MSLVLDTPRHGLAEDSLTRRGLVAGAAGAALLVTGCGTAADTAAPSPTSASTRLVEHAVGQSEIPVSPERVVALDPFLTLPTLVRAGVPVVGAIGSGEAAPGWLPESARAVQSIGSYTEPQLELVAELRPDLMIGFEAGVSTLPPQTGEIAPIVAVPSTSANGGWRDGMRQVVDYAGRAGAADEDIAAFDARLDSLAEAVAGQPLRSAALVRVRPDAVRLHGANHFGGSLLADVGLTPPAAAPAADNRENVLVELSPEEVSVVDSDIVFLLVGGGSQDPAASERARSALEANPLWAGLPAVAAGRVVPIGDHWGSGEVVAAGLVLDDIAAALDLDA